MLETGLLIVLCAILFAGGVYLLRLLFPPDDQTQNAPVKISAAAPEQLPAGCDFAGFVERKPASPRKTGKICQRLLSLTVLCFCGYYIYQNRPDSLPGLALPVSGEEATMTQQTITPAAVAGHVIVDGVNWFQIVATSTEGVPFEGWVSEMAILSKPPKENKMADEMLKKLGLPTNRERIESVKQIRKINQAINTALKNEKKISD